MSDSPAATRAVAASDIRRQLRRAADALPQASIGIVPILWNTVGDADVPRGTDAAELLDEIARIGYAAIGRRVLARALRFVGAEAGRPEAGS